MTGFEINGETYEVPMPSTFDMDEAQVFYDYTGWVVEEIWLGDLDWAEIGRKPGFLSALVHIAYRRAHEEEADADIKALVGKQNRLSLFGAMLTAAMPDEEDKEGNPEAPQDGASNSSQTLNETDLKQSGTETQPDPSGKTSKQSSAERGNVRAITGTTGSDGQSTLAPLTPAA